MRPANLQINYSNADGSVYTTTIKNNPGNGLRNATSIFNVDDQDSTSVIDLVTPDGHMTLLNKNTERIHTDNIGGVKIEGEYEYGTLLTYYSESPSFVLSTFPVQNVNNIIFIDINASPDGDGSYKLPYTSLDDAVTFTGDMSGQLKTFYIKNGSHETAGLHRNTHIIGTGNNVQVKINGMQVISTVPTNVYFTNLHVIITGNTNDPSIGTHNVTYKDCIISMNGSMTPQLVSNATSGKVSLINSIVYAGLGSSAVLSNLEYNCRGSHIASNNTNTSLLNSMTNSTNAIPTGFPDTSRIILGINSLFTSVIPAANTKYSYNINGIPSTYNLGSPSGGYYDQVGTSTRIGNAVSLSNGYGSWTNDKLKYSSLIGSNITYTGDEPEPQYITALGTGVNIDRSNALFITSDSHHIIIPGLTGMPSGVPVVLNGGSNIVYQLSAKEHVTNVNDLPAVLSMRKIQEDDIVVDNIPHTITHMVSMCKHLISELDQLKNDYAMFTSDSLLKPKQEAVDLFCQNIM